MKVTVLGPWGGYPKAGEASAGYLVQHNGYNLLIDCGSGVLSQLQYHLPVEELDSVLISHFHPDHIADTGVLYHGRLIQSKIGSELPVLPIYAHPYDEAGFQNLNHQPYTEARPYKEEDELELGPFTITFLETNHPVKCYAMRVTDGNHSMVFTADSSYKKEFAPFSNGADLLISECNLYSDMDGSAMGHMNSTDAASIAKEANVSTLILTHLPHFGNLMELEIDAKRIFEGEVLLASTGLVWDSEK
ncbi:MBL fold metallo-hydrolase [Guptibacillus hwajinpoensis]|uniref:Ribonuclease BN (tRNA processing enzyme) n=1 Tax=Guptibacillus hwajinpoensis TaxID=208199 RepID=A0ABU0K5K2_9BACL|nr:MBL fold metallo-hydrolase [Alkalihalobacillus hemicentroti]MDQ0484636.1 ribonuclease BN (tRNA processing enzyme) [Alkalihalobacillus hemicentroti]